MESALETTRRKLQEQLAALEQATKIETLLSVTGLLIKPWMVNKHRQGLEYITFRVKTVDDLKTLLRTIPPRKQLAKVVMTVSHNEPKFTWEWVASDGITYEIDVIFEHKYQAYGDEILAKVSYNKPRKYIYDPKLIFNWEIHGFNEPKGHTQYGWNSWGNNEWPPTYKVYWNDFQLPIELD